MTEEEKLIKHIDMLIETFNEAYKEYRNTAVIDNNQKSVCVGFLLVVRSDWHRISTSWEKT